MKYAAFVFSIMVAAGINLAIVHGLAELGQYLGLYPWEPLWQQTLFLTAVLMGFRR